MSGDADFVRAGQAAQAAVDKLTGRARLCVDAAEIGSRVGSIVRLLDDAAADRAHRRHTNAAALEQRARAELRELAGVLDDHFRRFADGKP